MLAAAVSVVGCSRGCSKPQGGAEPSPIPVPTLMFFQNSSRRDATRLEASQVAHVGGCAAFFLENSKDRVYLASARHCFEYQITDWCRTGSVTGNDGTTGTCTRVVAADDRHDIAVFEAAMRHASLGESTLRLAAYTPKVDTELLMIGYPADRDPTTARRGELTVTTDCWVLSGPGPSPHDDTLDRSAQHNCSTYGGNSGGPMIRKGSREVIGLPFTYAPNDYRRRSATDPRTAATLALTSDFVKIHRAELVEAGIVLVESPGDNPLRQGKLDGGGAPGDAGYAHGEDDGTTSGGANGGQGAGGTSGSTSGASTSGASSTGGSSEERRVRFPTACFCGVDASGDSCVVYRGTEIFASRPRATTDADCRSTCDPNGIFKDAMHEHCRVESGTGSRNGSGASSSSTSSSSGAGGSRAVSCGSSCSCRPGEDCAITCTGANCDVSCDARSTCNVVCSGANCNMRCGVGARCNMTCTGSHCTAECDGTCSAPTCTGSTCTCSGAGCP